MATEKEKVNHRFYYLFNIVNAFRYIVCCTNLIFCCRSRTISASRYRALPKTKSRKKKKRKRIIESDNQSENDDSNEEPRIEVPQQLENSEPALSDAMDIKLENNENKNINEIKDIKLDEMNSEISDIPVALPLEDITQQKKKKVNSRLPLVCVISVFHTVQFHLSRIFYRKMRLKQRRPFEEKYVNFSPATFI